MDHSRPAPPPEAALITAALKRARITARTAARTAGISDARWRQIVTGYQSVSGRRIPVKAPAETLARMALAVGVTGPQLADAGRDDAAQELTELTATDAPAVGYAPDPAADAYLTLLATLPPDTQAQVLYRIRHDLLGDETSHRRVS